MKSRSPTPVPATLAVFAALAAALFFATGCPRRDKPAAPPDAPSATSSAATPATFTNPLVVGADPWIIQHNGKYYWTLTDSNRCVAVWCSDSPVSIGNRKLCARKIVWRAPATGDYSQEIWAPELHFLDGRCYIYVAASNGRNSTHRMIVLESATDDPLGSYAFKAELYTGDNIDTKEKSRWAVDGTVFTRNGKLYFIWSGWFNTRGNQRLYIAPMSNPWTISGNRVRICDNNNYPWEHVGDSPQRPAYNEAPEILQHAGRTFLVYSASASWQTSYKMGMLELIGDDPLAPGAWRKYPTPVFAPTKTTFGIGHASFTKSPDGKQDWMIYHAKEERKDGWSRLIYAQPFTWTKDGLPDFGEPVARGQPLPLPSGAR